MKDILTRLSGFSALILATLGLWFSYVYPAFDGDLKWVYLQIIVYIVFLIPSLVLLSVSLLGKSRHIPMIAALLLGINAIAFLVTPYFATPM